MKKLLLSILLLFPLLTMSAAVCSINFSEQGYENAQEVTSVDINDDITLVFDKGTSSNTPKYYTTGAALRLYGGNTLTVKGAEGVTITSAELTYPTSNPVEATSTVSDGTLTIGDETAVWEGDANSFTFTQGGTKGHVRLVSISVTYAKGDAPTVAAVQYSVAAGQVAPGTAVELTCATADAKIYYTTDCSEPTAESTLYAEPIVITDDVVIKAIAVTVDGAQSAVSEAVYTVIETYTSLSEIVALAPKTKFVCGIDLTVFEARGAYVFVYDPKTDEYALIYKYDLGLEPCNIIEAGWLGSVAEYGKLNQLVPESDLTVSDEDGDLPSVLDVDADNIADIYVAANVRKPYILMGVKMLDAYNKKNGSGILGETEINLYNQFNIDVTEIEGDKVYNFYGILNSYNGTLQINPVEYELAETEDPEEPEVPAVFLYDSVGEVAEADDWGETAVPQIKDVAVNVYDQYVIIRAFAGVEGYDIKVGFGEDDSVAYVASIVDGVEGEAVESGYAYLYTGLEDVPYMAAYLVEDYCYAGLDEDESGYVLLSCYWGNESTYYYIYWPQDEETDAPLYEAVAQVTTPEGWSKSDVPEISDLTVEAYEDYVIIRAFAGVEGYDLKVGLGEDDAVTYVASITAAGEGEPAESGYVEIPTGREDTPIFKADLGNKQKYAGLYDEESGYVLLYGYWGADWTYYYCYWPQEDESEWVNPFEGEASYLYSAIGETTSADDEDWGDSLFPVVKDINVDVYDKYIYIKDVAGVEGYGVKVAYNEDDKVLSIMPVEDGVDGEPCKSYTYISTGREDISTIQAYTGGYSYAQSYEDHSGYVLLGAYLYGADNLSEWSYYYLVWEGETSSVTSISVNSGAAVYFDIKGGIVDKPAPGNVYIRVVDGKASKVLIK